MSTDEYLIQLLTLAAYGLLLWSCWGAGRRIEQGRYASAGGNVGVAISAAILFAAVVFR